MSFIVKIFAGIAACYAICAELDQARGKFLQSGARRTVHVPQGVLSGPVFFG